MTVHAQLQRILGARALAGEEALAPYGVDESGLGPYPPDAVALVETAGEVREVLRMAERDRLVVTPRGLGSGMTGGALPVQGGIVLSTERMRRIVGVDADDLLAVVEPGVITGDLQAAVEDAGLFYPPDPASLEICSLGGNVAENAGGPRAFKYGVTREYVLGLRSSLIGGEVLDVGRRTVKGVTGLDLVALLTGSEGTLAVFNEITLKLLPKPQAVAAFLAPFADVGAAGTAVAELIRAGHRPRTLELLDQHVVEHLRLANSAWPLPAGRCALLLVEVDGELAGIEAQLLAAAEGCERAGAREILVATDEARRRSLWEMRRAANPSLKEQHRFKLEEDVVVPRNAIPAMLARLDELATASGMTIACFGHAGDGNLHVNVLFDDRAQLGGVDAVLEQVARHALDLGGTLAGEHGIGCAKGKWLHLEQSTALLALQRRLKAQFDPLGLLNPGKLYG